MTRLGKLPIYALLPLLIAVYAGLGLKGRLSRRPGQGGWVACDLDTRFAARPKSRL